MFKLIFFILFICNISFADVSSNSLQVTVTVLENYDKPKIIKTNYVVNQNDHQTINFTPIVFSTEKDGIKTTFLIRETNVNRYYCSAKFNDGRYIDQEKNIYLMDKETNSLVLNHINDKNNKVLMCPKITLSK